MSRIHYFQRYSQKENAVTNNTLLLFSRLYQYSPLRFEDFLHDILVDIPIEVGVDFKQQTRTKTGKKKTSIPDGLLSQNSFRIVLETKLDNNFTLRQLKGHLSAFGNETTKVLLLLKPVSITIEQRRKIEELVKDFNKDHDANIQLVATTFEDLISSYERVLKDRDYDMRDLIQDYEQFCDDDGLLPHVDHTMRAVSCGKSLNENFEFNLYYHPADWSYRLHKYIGIYSNKSVRGIGEMENVIHADMIGNKLNIIDSTEPITDGQRKRIIKVIPHAKEHCGYNIQHNHKFFLVKHFYPTDYHKVSKGPLRGTKYFNLLKKLGVEELPGTEEIAVRLRELKW